jgi:hypothetical protein
MYILKRLILFSGILVLLLVAVSCSQTTQPASIHLMFGNSQTIPVVNAEKTYEYVVRCTELKPEKEGLTLVPTKSKGEKITDLVFFNLPASPDNTVDVPVAVVAVNGIETDYDLSKAKYYNISLNSARDVANKYAIMFAIWSSGAGSPAEKFDCCE